MSIISYLSEPEPEPRELTRPNPSHHLPPDVILEVCRGEISFSDALQRESERRTQSRPSPAVPTPEPGIQGVPTRALGLDPAAVTRMREELKRGKESIEAQRVGIAIGQKILGPVKG